MSSHAKTLYLLDDQATLRLDGDALRVSRPQKSDSLIPLRRVGRAVIHPGEEDLLKACLALVKRGGIVHFQDRSGRLCAVLQQAAADGTRQARDLASRIEERSGNMRYQEWRRNQQRHSWSLVFHQDFCSDFESNRKRLIRYLSFYRPELETAAELKWLEDALLAWLQAQIEIEGLQPVVRALHKKGEQLTAALLPCLFIPLLWAYVQWRRVGSAITRNERTAFFELQAAAPLRGQLDRHIEALDYAYSDSRHESAADILVNSHRVHLP